MLDGAITPETNNLIIHLLDRDSEKIHTTLESPLLHKGKSLEWVHFIQPYLLFIVGVEVQSDADISTCEHLEPLVCLLESQVVPILVQGTVTSFV